MIKSVERTWEKFPMIAKSEKGMVPDREQAPFDGRPYLVWSEQGIFQSKWEPAKVFSGSKNPDQFCFSTWLFEYPVEKAHGWMPLPEHVKRPGMLPLDTRYYLALINVLGNDESRVNKGYWVEAHWAEAFYDGHGLWRPRGTKKTYEDQHILAWQEIPIGLPEKPQV